MKKYLLTFLSLLLLTSYSYSAGDPKPPKTVKEHAQRLSTNCQYRDEHFQISDSKNKKWQWQYQQCVLTGLQQPHIPRDNVATALTVLSALKVKLTTTFVNQIIEQTKVAGRTEMFRENCDIMLDVGHNPHAARYLANIIKQREYPKVHAVFSMLADKDIAAVVTPLASVVSHWYISELDVDRAATVAKISQPLVKHQLAFEHFDNVCDAYKMAKEQAQPNDLVLVFGSFFTVAQIRRLLVSVS